jgi:hypothetical protein
MFIQNLVKLQKNMKRSSSTKVRRASHLRRYAGIFQHFRHMQPLQFAIRPNALALGFEAKAAVGLVIAADSNVTCGFP